MQRLRVLAVGKLKEAWMREGIREYEKRLSGRIRLELTELPAAPLPENPSEKEILRALEEEGRRILEKGADARLIPLCVEGDPLSSGDLASLIRRAGDAGETLAFVIGGSRGLAESVKERGRPRISFSRMTFPHRLMRVLLLEQIYRAVSILEGTPYHK